MTNKPKPQRTDVVIIGAGASGAAYDRAEEEKEPACEVFMDGRAHLGMGKRGAGAPTGQPGVCDEGSSNGAHCA